MGARPYNPNLGRFLAVDPVDGGSLNNYDYAGQDPVNAYDLDGRRPTGLGNGWTLRKDHEEAVAVYDEAVGDALRYLYEHPDQADGTVGVCIGIGGAFGGVGAFIDGCYVVSLKTGKTGYTVTGGLGIAAGAGASASLTVMASNAKCAKQLGGKFDYGSAGAAWIYGGAAAMTAHGGGISTAAAGVAAGLGGAGVSAGISYTLVFGGGNC